VKFIFRTSHQTCRDVTDLYAILYDNNTLTVDNITAVHICIPNYFNVSFSFLCLPFFSLFCFRFE